MWILTTKQLFPPKYEYGLDRVRSPDREAAGWTPARNYTRAEQFKEPRDFVEILLLLLILQGIMHS